jgi:dihydrofolate reductase
VTRQRNLTLKGAEVAHSLDHALQLARQTDPEPRIIGGGQLYAESVHLATRIELTLLDENYQGDSYFPELDPSEWHCSHERRGDRVVYRTLDRL